MGESTPSRSWIWTARQRTALAIVLLTVIGGLAVVAWRNPLRSPPPLPDQGPLATQVASRIDPNTADAGQLAALPVIGPRRAQDIVEYRSLMQSQTPGSPVFGKLADVGKVKGIGAATLEALEPFLVFPEAAEKQP